jgi:hypothetical protein
MSGQRESRQHEYDVAPWWSNMMSSLLMCSSCFLDVCVCGSGGGEERVEDVGI